MANDGEPTQDFERDYPEQLSIDGIFLHIRAIIALGRTTEFLELCKQKGYTTLRAPVGAAEFATTFVLSDGPENREISARERSALEWKELIRNKNPDKC